MDEVGRAQEVLNRISKEFICSASIKAPFLGRTIQQIEDSKAFAVNYLCPEQAILTAHRLKQAGFNPDLVVEQRNAAFTTHFFVCLQLNGDYYEAHLGKDNKLHNARDFRSTLRTTYTKVPFNLHTNQSIKSAMKGRLRLVLLGKAVQPFVMRRWPLPINRRKDEKKAVVFTQILKQGRAQSKTK
jgi:hypothetical protein